MPTARKINVDILTGQKLSHLFHPIQDKPAAFRKVVVLIFLINKVQVYEVARKTWSLSKNIVDCGALLLAQRQRHLVAGLNFQI